MGNLNDRLVSGDQTSTTDDSAGRKPDVHSPSSALATFQRTHMGKVSPDKIDEHSLEISEIDKAPDKTSAAYAPKKRFLKDYQTEGSLTGGSASLKHVLNEKVGITSSVVSKHEVSTIPSRPPLETMNISSCIGVIVESELTKYEMCKDNSDTPGLNEKSVLPLLFTPYSDQTSDSFDDKRSQRSPVISNISKDKLKHFAKGDDQCLDNAKHDVEIIACSPEISSQQRHDKVKMFEIEKNILSTSKSRELASYETLNISKSYSPKLYRASPLSGTQSYTQMAHVTQSNQCLDEWRNNPGPEKSSYTTYGMKLNYADPKLSKVHDLKSHNHVPFKTPGDLNFRRADLQFSPKLSRHQSPREMSSSDNSVAMTYAREDVHGRGIDPRFYPNPSSGEKYVQHSHSSSQMRVVVDETPIDLRIKKKEKPLGYSSTLISHESLEGKRQKLYGYPYDQSIKTGGQYYYLPAEADKGHHGSMVVPSLPYNPAFLKTGETETLKTYLTDPYNHPFSSRHSEIAVSRPKLARSEVYPFREGYGTSKVTEENPSKPQMLEKWDRGPSRLISDQLRSVSRKQQEPYEQDLMSSHYLKYFEANRSQDQKSSSPRLIPQLLPIPSMNHLPKSQSINYVPSHDSQNFQCKFCNSVYNSYRSFRMHIVKDHNMEPHPEHCSLSVVDVKSSMAYGQDRGFPVHKARQEGDGFHSTPKQVAEVYPIISKVVSTCAPQGGMSGIDHMDPKFKNTEKIKTDVKAITNRDGIDDIKQVLPWDCRHQLTIDSEMNCTTCMEGFQDITDWRAHISSMHMVRSCACRTCNKWFANAEELNKHLQGVHPEQRHVDVEYRCLYCRKAFTDEEVLYIHTREHERALSISRNEAKSFSKGDTEIQKAVPDTTCPESDQKVVGETCDVASTISPTSDCDQDKFLMTEESRGVPEVDHERVPSSKKSFFLKKFQREEMNMSVESEIHKAKSYGSESCKPNEKMSPTPRQKFVTARSIIDNLVTEGLTRNANFSGFSKIPTSANMMRCSESKKSNESKGSHEICGQSPEFLLSTSELNLKQPLLKDMLLQINSKSHLSFGTETKSNFSQPRTKCVRDICDEIITHSFRESSPVGPAERLKIFDSIAFDTTSTKTEGIPCPKPVKGISISSSRSSTDSNATSEYRDTVIMQDHSLVDSTASMPSQSNVIVDSKMSSESLELVKQSHSSPPDGSKVSVDVSSDADSTCRNASNKDSRTPPTQSLLGKRSHTKEVHCLELNSDDQAINPSDENNPKDVSENDEPPFKK